MDRESPMHVVHCRQECLLIAVPNLSEHSFLSAVAFNALGPALCHGFQLRRIPVYFWPLGDQIEAGVDKNRIDPPNANTSSRTRCRTSCAMARTSNLARRSHQRNGSIGRRDSHSLGVDADEHFTDLVKRSLGDGHRRHGVVQ